MPKLAIRGVNYDTGTAYVGGKTSRLVWSLDDVRRDMGVIAGDLGCTHVCVYGTDTDRLIAAAEIALAAGLDVSVQRRVVDVSREEMRIVVTECARRVAALGADGRVMINIGCEASLFTRGFIPGGNVLSRLKALGLLWPVLLPWIYFRLGPLLTRIASDVRTVFNGPVTYSAGTWETVDWTAFDFVGVDLYRDRHNEKSYVRDLRGYLAHGKPLIITEFGCCAFEGAERLGGAGWLVADHSKEPSEVKPGYTRSEAVQARHIGEMVDLFEAEAVHGAFVFTFVEAGSRHDEDPRYDLDMASYGLVKVLSSQDEPNIRWAPKEAFATVAARFGPRRIPDPGAPPIQ